MSFRKKFSFRKRSDADSVREPDSVCESSDVDAGESPGPAGAGCAPGVAATLSESDETLSAGIRSTATVSQRAQDNDRDLGSEAIEDSAEIMESRLDTPAAPGPPAPQPRLPATQSFAIPDGLAMDPMAPTALAVSSEFMDRIGSGLTLLREHGKKIQKYVSKCRRLDSLKRSSRSVVNVMLVEARDLPEYPASGPNCVYCKFRLGSELHKTKTAPKLKPSWYERFNLNVGEESNLEITLWHKGKQKNFMGRCTIDLSRLDREKTHDLWQELECGFGSIHLLVTVSCVMRNLPVDNVPTTNGVRHLTPSEEEFMWYKVPKDWSSVGHLSVTVHGARGLSALGISGRADAYCVLELDNARVQTHVVSGTAEPNWGKSFQFSINDITSTLDITVYDESILNEVLGKVSIPLLRINNEEQRWYALKDRTKKSSAKGNCPRILLQMSVAWNPVKATFRVLSPKETKYLKKTEKFDIPLIYSNVKFIGDIFDALQCANECYKRSFEWENREKSVFALLVWLTFWFFFRLWMLPVILLAPFVYFWTGYRSCSYNALVPVQNIEDDLSEDDTDVQKDDKTIKSRLYSLQELTFNIKNSIDYLVSLLERIKNLASFAVPYLSYLAGAVLAGLAVVLYVLPINYIFMALGIYKFTRKWMNPERVPNNDLLDFLSRVPDNETLKQWRELKVPEPITASRNGSLRRR